MKVLHCSKGLWRLVDDKETFPENNTSVMELRINQMLKQTNIEADLRVHIRSTQNNPVTA